MANFTSPVPQVVEGTAAVAKLNQLIDAMSQALIGGKNWGTTALLVWGYLGGRVNGINVANGTVTLTGSTTNYVVMKKSDGVVSTSTATTNWNDSTDYWRLYSVVTSSTTVTDYNDERFSAEGLFGSSGGGGAVAADDVSYDNSTSGLTATDVQAAIDEVAGLSPSATVQCIPIACSDETTALTAGTAKVTFRMPFAFTLTAVRASVTTAPTGGTLLTVDINESGSTILSTKLTIDASEKTSTTAATPAVISDSSLADDAEMTIDIDSVGSTIAGAGLKVYLIGTKT